MNYFPQTRSFRLLVIGILICILVVIIRIFVYQPNNLANQGSGRNPEAWMTVFIHGSFGSLLGFLNFSDVLNDRIPGTTYRNIIKKMRDDPFFYKDQPILKRGLIAIEPTFDPQAFDGNAMVVHAIAQGYRSILESIRPGQEKNYFYTFGWTGLMSQKSRRYESIRLYNALSEEIERFKSRGIFPKIRLVGHSHAGNLSLNLAAVKKALRYVTWNPEKNIVSDVDKNESIKKMAAVLRGHTTKEIAKTKTDQKTYDYVPEKSDLVIDELIMFGTPIQPETECFCGSSMFKKIYNFYSHSDVVQRLDWVTSKRTLSNQRISNFPHLHKDGKMHKTHLIQVRLMAEKPIEDGKIQLEEQVYAQADGEEVSVIESLLSKKSLLLKESKDPTHKELWFLQWQDEGSEFGSFLAPLPVVILTPLLVYALESTHHSADVDIDVVPDGDIINVYVANYKAGTVLGRVSLDRAVLAEIQEKIKQWKPEDLSHIADFKASYEHLWQ